MPISHRRLLMTACLLVCACSKAPDAPQTNAQAQHSDAPLQRSELGDWARDATSASNNEPQHQQAAASRDASDALATPVIHTVD